MKHTISKQQLLLFTTGDVTDALGKKIEQHLCKCAACRAEVDDLKSMKRMLQANAPVVDPATLKSLRSEILRQLRPAGEKSRSRTTVLDAVRGFLGFAEGALLRPAFTVAAVAVIAFAAGTALPGSRDSAVSLFTPIAYDPYGVSSGQSSGLNDAQVISVTILSKDDETGEIEFEFEATFRSRASGNIGDPAIQGILARALISSQNPGVRLRAVNAFSGSSPEASLPRKTREIVKQSLISALKYDENHGVRIQSLKALEAFLPDSAATEAVVHILTHDENSALRIAAIGTLDLSMYKDPNERERLSEVLRQRSLLDENNYIRIKAMTALQEEYR